MRRGLGGPSIMAGNWPSLIKMDEVVRKKIDLLFPSQS
jgi:hypothetical protein